MVAVVYLGNSFGPSLVLVQREVGWYSEYGIMGCQQVGSIIQGRKLSVRDQTG